MIEIDTKMLYVFLVILFAIACISLYATGSDVALMSIFGLLLAVVGAAVGIEQYKGKP